MSDLPGTGSDSDSDGDSDGDLVVERVFDAPRELVWRCLTEPEHLTRFWGPAGMTTPLERIVVELRPGGRFETLMTGAHGEHRMVAVFTEVDAPRRLAWTEPASGMRTTGTFTELDGERTAVVIRQRNAPAATRAPQGRAGFLSSLDKLADHLAQFTKDRPVTDPQTHVAPTFLGLAELLDADDAAWDASSLCAGWRVRHVVAHVTMPARMTPEGYGAELAAAGGDFTVLSNTVAERDSALPTADLLANLRSPVLHAWQPPGGGAAGALSHAVIHSLDVTVALDRAPAAPVDGLLAVFDQLAGTDGAIFGVDLSDVRLEATDAARGVGSGEVVRADLASLVALLGGRRLPDGRQLGAHRGVSRGARLR